MPRGDKTGPRGQGPMTGRAAGYGAGYDVPGYMNQGVGFGMGWGGGFGRGGRSGLGRGWGRRFGWNCPFCGGFGPQNKNEEKEYNEEYIKGLEKELKEAKKYSNELGREE